MSQVVVHVRSYIGAPASVVWPRLTDHEAMPAWWPLTRVTLEPEGAPDRNGLGAVRVMVGPGTRLREEVVSWDPPHSYRYRVLDGAPIRDHQGLVELHARGTGSEVDWRIEFDPVVPGTGWLIGWVLDRVLRGALARLKRQIEAGRRV